MSSKMFCSAEKALWKNTPWVNLVSQIKYSLGNAAKNEDVKTQALVTNRLDFLALQYNEVDSLKEKTEILQEKNKLQELLEKIPKSASIFKL